MSEEQALNVIELISHQPMSKDSACSYLKISRSKFDELVRKGDLPKGRKRRGFKELVWWKDEIDPMRKMWL
jgi:predicted DNA-binding transcriptional regulator AlpA